VRGYVVIIEHEAGSYGAWSPDLPGCIAAASDYEECVQLMHEAIELHLAGLREDGEPLQSQAKKLLAVLATPAGK